MLGKIRLLGTGSSAGVPQIGCSCAVCSSDSPFNKRLRCAALVEIEGKTLLIDAGPDCREQCLRYGVRHLDGLLITHAHYDHIGGLEELREFNRLQKKALPCLLSQESWEQIRDRLPHLMRPVPPGHNAVAIFQFHHLETQIGMVQFAGVRFLVVTYRQGGMSVNGYRFGDLAYISDIRDYTPQVVEQLKGTKILIVSALQHEPHFVHFSIGEALAFADEIGASQVYFTHLAHLLDYEATNASLPPHAGLAYDGLEVYF